jgi:hypothetical protein
MTDEKFARDSFIINTFKLKYSFEIFTVSSINKKKLSSNKKSDLSQKLIKQNYRRIRKLCSNLIYLRNQLILDHNTK